MAENEQRNHQPLVDLIRRLADEGTQTFVFADMFHPDPSIRETAAAPDVMDALKEAGVTRLTLETHPATLQTAESYHNADEPERQQLLSTMRTPYHPQDPQMQERWKTGHLDQVIQATERGMDVLVPDPRYAEAEPVPHAPDPQEAARKELLDAQIGAVTDPRCPSYQYSRFMASLSPQEQALLHMPPDTAADTNPANPVTNTAIADAAQDSPEATGKQAYFYGVAHTAYAHDLDEMTPRAVTIALADAPGSEAMARLLFEQGATDVPDYVYYTQQGRVETLNTEAAQREFIYGHPEGANITLTPEQQAACIESVAHLIPYVAPEAEREQPVPVPSPAISRGAGAPER